MHEKALDFDPSSAQALCDYAELLLSRGGVGAQEQHALAIQLLDRCFTACPPPSRDRTPPRRVTRLDV